MKRILVLAVIAAALAGCGGPKLSPLEQAISDYVVDSNPGLKSINLYDVALREEVTFGAELQRRQALFETKLKVEQKMKSVKRQQDAQHVAEILGALDDFAERNAALKDNVIYRIYDFQISGKMEDGAQVAKTAMAAAVDCSGNVLKLFTSPSGNVYSGMGIALPGYKELLESLNASE